MSRSFSIRPVRAEDIEILIALYVACFREPPWLEVFAPEEVRADFDAILSWPEAIFLVAVDDLGAVIGAGIGFGVCRKADVCRLLPDASMRQSFYVAELFVDPSSRTRGVCRSLTAGLIDRAAAAGFLALSVRTSVDQLAIRHLFVGTLGYREVATEEVLSRKLVDGRIVDVPDTRVVMAGEIRSGS
ncbi:GNAT family N-acetyltransferase [bacterium]|nr:GNAT family N-acetyltransferase [bacterium]